MQWKVVPNEVSPGIFQLQIFEALEKQLAKADEIGSETAVIVGGEGALWAINPPLSEGGADTPRT